jgi:two-component SAPR family response regulator
MTMTLISFFGYQHAEINGIDFLKNAKTGADIIMTTAYAEYAVEAFGPDVTDYLVKPLPFDRFLKACYKVKEIRSLKKATQPNLLKPAIIFL